MTSVERSVVVNSLFIVVPHRFRWGLFVVLVYCALFGVVPSFVVISLEKRELVALLKYHFSLNLTVSVLCLFLKVRWLGLKCGISWSYSLFHVILFNFKKSTL